MTITKMKMKRRISKTRKMSEILEHATVIIDSRQPTNTIDNNVADAIENGDRILPKSAEKYNISKLKQKRFIPKRRSLSEIMNTTTPVTNFCSLTNTGNDDVCSLPPINAIDDDVIFPTGNIDPDNPIPSRSSLHKPHRKKKINPRAQNTASAISPPPPNTLKISPTIDSPTLVNATSREARAFCSLVKIECVHFQPNLRTYTSGFVIKGKKILTTAHSVAYYTHLMLSKNSSNIKYVGTVLAIGTECDIGEDLELGQGFKHFHFFMWVMEELV